MLVKRATVSNHCPANTLIDDDPAHLCIFATLVNESSFEANNVIVFVLAGNNR